MFSKDDLRCAHPNHPRTWYSKNLWCGSHLEPCPICQNPCCTLSCYEKALQKGDMSPSETERVQRLLKEIMIWIPGGSDESTFMECTGCHKFVCPECCSVCPHPYCGDRMCRVGLLPRYALAGANFNKDCNPDRQWILCDLHDEMP